jgi:hypothetical protein
VRQSTEWEKGFENYVFGKELQPENIRDSKNSIAKNQIAKLENEQ